MATTWQDVVATDAYRAADEQKRKRWRDEWYTEKVVPYAKSSGQDAEKLRSDFYAVSESLDPAIAPQTTTLDELNQQDGDRRTMLGKAVDAMTTPWPLGYLKDQEQTAPPTPPQTRYIAPRDEAGNILPERSVEETLTVPFKPGAGTASLGDIAKTAGLLNPGTFIPAAVAQAAEGFSPLGRTVESLPSGMAVDIPLGMIGVKGATAGARGLRGLYEASPLAIPEALGNLAQAGYRGVRGAAQGLRRAAPIADDVAEAIPRVAEEAGNEFQQVLNVVKKDKAYGQLDLAGRLSKAKKTATEYFVDASGNLKAELKKLGPDGETARVELEAIKGAPAKANIEMQAVYDDIYGGLKKTELDELDAAIRARRTAVVDDYKAAQGIEMKHGGITGEQARAAWEQAPLPIKEKAEKYFATYKTYLQRSLDEGFIDQKAYDALVQHDYSPRQFLDYIDPHIKMTDWKGQPISIRSSGVQSLHEGAEGAMQSDSRVLLSDFIARFNGRLARNNANKALAQLADVKPGNGVVKAYVPEMKLSPRDEMITYFDGGQRKALVMPKDFAREWMTADPQMSSLMMKTLNNLSGAKIVKAMATGYNPEFAMMNIARDFVHAIVTQPQYSKVLPVAAAQLGNDMRRVFKDAVFKRGRYIDYMMQGGGRDMLTQMGQVKMLDNVPGLNKVGHALRWLGETSEILTRLAVRERAIKEMAKKLGRPLTQQELKLATNRAANLIDFSQGGSLAKAIDQFVPYMNAGIQGTRTMIRAARENPARFTAMITQLGAFSAALAMRNQFKDRDAINSFPESVRNAYWLLPIGSYRNRSGDMEHLAIRIAKDQGQRPFASLFEQIGNIAAGVVAGDSNALQRARWKQVAHGLADALPVGLHSVVPPTIKALMTYMANYDLFRGENVWKGADVIPRAETTKGTGEIWKLFGALGMSPERTKVAMQQVFTYNNPISAVSDAGKLIAQALGDDATAEDIKKIPALRRVLIAANPRQRYKDIIDTAEREGNTSRMEFKREIGGLIRDYWTLPTQGKRERMMDRVKELPIDQRKEAMQMIREGRQYKDIQDINTVTKLKRLDPESRAVAYYKIMNEADEGKKESLLRDTKKVRGFWSPKFRRALQQVRPEEL